MQNYPQTTLGASVMNAIRGIIGGHHIEAKRILQTARHSSSRSLSVAMDPGNSERRNITITTLA